jgi:hypothetical protein
MTGSNGRTAARLLGATVWGLVLILTLGVAGAEDAMDWHRAQDLFRRSRNGQQLTADEQAYLARAMEERRQQMTNVPPARERTGLMPLTEMGDAAYKRQSGGLYGAGRNEPPERHLQAALVESGAVVPRNADGEPAAGGRIVLISIGMSNTTQEFSAFKRLADADPGKSPDLVIVDGAQGGKDARAWMTDEQAAEGGGRSTWQVLDERLRAAGTTPAQVQVVWLKQALAMPALLGDFPAHARRLEDDVAQALRIARKRFPNLRLAYLSSRIYAGYATTALNPEPYAYESAFSVQWLIAAQVKGDPALNWSPERGEVKAPLILWGPYLWGDGLNPRKADGLVWKREDLGQDGTHPSPSGQRKVAGMLLAFFKADPTARTWFLARQKQAAPE